MRKCEWRRWTTLAAVLALAGPAEAQDARKWSLAATIASEIGLGAGGELELRYRPSAWSFGGGAMTISEIDPDFTGSASFAGPFLEMRYAWAAAGRRVAPYVAARVALLKEDHELFVGRRDVAAAGPPADTAGTATAVGLGAGLMIRLVGRVGLDLGALALQRSGSVNSGTAGYGRVGLSVALWD